MSYIGQRLIRTDGVRFFSDVSGVEPAAIRLKALREAASPRLSVRKLADELGLPASSYAFYEDPKKFKKRYLPVELTKSLTPILTRYEIDLWDVLALGGLEKGADADDTSGSNPSEDLDLVAITEVDQDYGMGGTFTGDHVELQIHHFPRLWVESITLSPSDYLTIARGKGDSMDPTIRDRDMVIIDRSRRKLDETDAIWALNVGDIGMIKRLRLRGSTVIIQSDNDRVKDEEVQAEEVHLVGRVVFIGRRT